MRVKKSIECKISKKDEELFDKFIHFLKKEYPLEHDIEIRFMSSRLDEMTTGGRTNKHTLKILTKGRMNRDILRTIGHEWVHEYQRTVLGRKKQANIGSKNENEANAKAGELLKKFEDKYPKLVDSLYENIVKKVIRESLEEESDKNDWDWIENVNPFTPGDDFEDDDICFNSDASCRVNINNDNITFVLDYDWWKEFSDIDEDDANHIEPLLINPNYDGNGDYYDFDYDEFNYSGYYITDEQKERFQKILDMVSPGTDFQVFKSDNMNDLKGKLKYEPLKNLYDHLLYSYLDIIGYQIQKNRWLSTGHWLKEILKRINTTFKLQNWAEIITIKVAMEEVFKLQDKNINSLTDILKSVSSNISNESWYDGFFEDWDISGAEDSIQDAFDSFLDSAEEFLDDEEISKPYKEFEDLMKSLDFKQISYISSGTSYISQNPNHNTQWYVTNVDFEDKSLSLKLYPWNGTVSSTPLIWTEPLRSFVISFDELPTYVNNYSLNY